MIIIKILSLIAIVILSSYTGILISNKYKNRVNELKEIKKSLNIFKTKIRYTYEPVPDIFLEISQNLKENISQIFKNASMIMEYETANDAWMKAVEQSKTNMNKEDLEVIKGLGKLLGKTDIDGQVSQIELTDKFVDIQIEKARNDYQKNEKLYKTLRNSIWFDTSNYIVLNKLYISYS